MMVGQIFTKIGNFIENRQTFMLLNCNCAKLANLFKFSKLHLHFQTTANSLFFKIITKNAGYAQNITFTSMKY